MKNFKIANRITGWIVFLIAATVYLLTIEPTTSFWDCGEFIASAFKLEVGHPPGAPLFMIIARVFSIFAGDVTEVAKMVNAMSGLASAFTILFLFWTITHLTKKMFPANKELTTGQLIVVIGSGVVGALTYTFSDTFWFSAVEGEVYGLSSLFTAVVFWAILKWENIADEKYSNRWLIFIAYLMGLSIGVHLLNLLAIPAIVFVYYFKKYPVTRNGVIKTFIIAIAILASIMYLIIPGIIKVASVFELLFVNGFGLPFKSGAIFYMLILIGLIVWGINYTHKKKKVLMNTVLVSFAVIMIGYSSFAMIVIRSIANPPMDENNPETVFNLLHYLNREQYGDRPLFKGQYYNAPVVDSKDPYTYRQKDGKYVKVYSLNSIYEFDERFTTIFPRMYSQSNPDHAGEYKKWADIKGKKVTVTGYNGEPEIKYVPTFGENLRFFFTYQMGHMYWRYFMWNFAGRQNDTQSHGELLNGNWITGINFIDNNLIGPQENIPDHMKHAKSRNVYYMLPFLLGIFGFFFHMRRNFNDFIVTLLLFVLTGIAIVVYLNQYPLQPRERDYAYAGSFYAFAIWIGIGVVSIYNFFQKKIKTVASASLATLICLIAVPVNMASENWDDHDRSNRYIARDFAYNYLNSCAPNAILFTHGDNDTFPLWYAQEVEGIRTDVRVVNLSLLNTDWYIDQMKRKAYDSEPVPFGSTHEQYLNGTRDVIYINERINEYVPVDQAVDFVFSDDARTKLQVGQNEWIDYLPTNKFIVPVDAEKVIANGTVKPEDADKIVPEIRFELKKSRIMKNELMILDLLATNNWERPIYFVSTAGDGNIGIDDYLQLEGFAYRLVPIKTPAKGYLETGRIDTDTMYKKLMEDFLWGNMEQPETLMDYTTVRTVSVIKIRNNFNRLAKGLIQKGQLDSAVAVLDRCVELMPKENVPYDLFTLDILETYYFLGENEKANVILSDFADISIQELNYYFSLPAKYSASLDYDIRLAIHYLQRLNEFSQRFGDPEIAVEIEAALNNAFNQYSARNP
jgi:tetratricopeptide (TPR) repeat protein